MLPLKTDEEERCEEGQPMWPKPICGGLLANGK